MTIGKLLLNSLCPDKSGIISNALIKRPFSESKCGFKAKFLTFHPNPIPNKEEL
jgi:hypothetical protein